MIYLLKAEINLIMLLFTEKLYLFYVGKASKVAIYSETKILRVPYHFITILQTNLL